MERSVSRGREGMQSSGRGGLGNIRPTSLSRTREDGPDDFSSTRGREPIPDVEPQHVYSTGRGGAGNIRSPSRDVKESAGPDAREREIVREYDRRESTEVHSSGRGGLGNISRSHSRGGLNPTPPRLHSVGRGGAGNIKEGDGINASLLEESERRARALHDNPVHSTGRGGLANMAQSPSPPIEHPSHQHSEFESHGRGGAGNMRDRSQSRGPEQRTPSREKHGLSGLLHKVTHPRETFKD
ncbi:hypothetical protein BDZ89DRAFT_1124768 [Hymenopellis radicata]|nr:hypothetical protein BDZ89DRAFT_1124768 [Hymenopellis radicata]